MKLETARISNFKLLRDIELSFSTDRAKPLTVIRAENGSGKTSTLQALRWALYGKEVLEDPQVRLSPADWPDGEVCKIAVAIEFIHTSVTNVGDQPVTSETSYLLKREVEEKPKGDLPNRGQEKVSLYEKTEAGSSPIEPAESHLAEMLPREMIDIFFTDGDAAMTFISPSLSDRTKQDKVKDAIRSLLGLELLEHVQKRISTVQSEVNKKIGKAAGSERLSEVTEKIESLRSERNELVSAEEQLNSEIDSTQKKLEKTQRDLQAALASGSHEELSHRRDQYEHQLEEAKAEEKKLKREHQRLFQSESLSWALLRGAMESGFALLRDLHAKGIIPRAAVPVIQERLELGKCICGADLSEGCDARKHVQSLIEGQKEADEQVDYLSSLYYSAKSDSERWKNVAALEWKHDVDELGTTRASVSKRIEIADRELKSVLGKLDQIDEEKIQSLRNYEKLLSSSVTKKNGELTRNETRQSEIASELQALETEQKKLSREDEKVAGLTAEKVVLDDLDTIVSGALQEMQSTYLHKVSDRMNDLFLEMVGADPEQNATFQGACIDNNYRIIVKTKDGRTLNPDYEVNGASQRALTFAFIWALTEVSGVVAPRVIDTPLGMMSGNVKRRVLNMVSQAAGEQVDRQVVLFLTQSEISHTEAILDTRVGRSMTLTKSDDYPADLVNDPRADQSVITICDCSHRQYCDTCQRTNFEDYKLEYRSA
jgi:DNA sulfur modification protein DndD